MDFKKQFRHYVTLFIGAAVLSFGLFNVHSQSQITEGGILGLTLFLHRWTGISPGVFSFLLDMTCYLVGFKLLGRDFLKNAIFASCCYALLYRFWEFTGPTLPSLADRPLSAALLGGLFVGVGAGLIVRRGGASGGDDALALILHSAFGWKVSRCYFFTDFVVLMLSLTYIPARKILFSLLTVLLSSAVIGLIHQTPKRRLSMEPKITIRNEEKRDWETVEEITRKAFYNLYEPGCAEHYLIHIMRTHEDFIPELDFVLELNGRVIGNVMYTKATLSDENGRRKEILTFGPVCIHPDYQRRGYGKRLLEHSFQKAVEMGYDAIVIFGSPANYVSRGFKSCQKYGVRTENGKYPAAMMVKELIPHALEGHTWIYRDSPVMAISEEEARRYDDTLAPMEKKHLPSQEEFYIMSRSFLE